MSRTEKDVPVSVRASRTKKSEVVHHYRCENNPSSTKTIKQVVYEDRPAEWHTVVEVGRSRWDREQQKYVTDWETDTGQFRDHQERRTVVKFGPWKKPVGFTEKNIALPCDYDPEHPGMGTRCGVRWYDIIRNVPRNPNRSKEYKMAAVRPDRHTEKQRLNDIVKKANTSGDWEDLDFYPPTKKRSFWW